jgi:peroxiredoxin Q/BCP
MPLRQSSILIASLAAATPLVAQQSTPPQEAQPLAVGTVAPDFSLPGATRFGQLANPVHLSDFKGKTVVIAFFFKARTRG